MRQATKGCPREGLQGREQSRRRALGKLRDDMAQVSGALRGTS